MKVLIIDLSYYNFYRYYATIQWYKCAHPEDNYEPGYDWSINVIFMEKFEKMFLNNITKFKKKFKPDKIILARDCPRKEIWRMGLYPGYKGTREASFKKNKFMGGPVFQFVYQNILQKILSDSCKVYKVDNLEGDDLIYLSTQKILSTNQEAIISIISSDHDLLQIKDGSENINLYKANLKCYSDKSYGSADLDCFAKAILGDNSDNIPRVFNRCGKKTMLKLYEDKSLLEEKFKKEEGSKERYNLNRQLVDFSYIPKELQMKFSI